MKQWLEAQGKLHQNRKRILRNIAQRSSESLALGRNSGMLDKDGDEIYEGHRLSGSFEGQGGIWRETGIVRHDSERGFLIELENGRLVSFNHPKFSSSARREIVWE